MNLFQKFAGREIKFNFISSKVDMGSAVVDKNILIELKSGNKTSFELVYRAFSKRLYALIYKIVKNVDQTDDILQLTFVKVWDNRAEIDTEKSFDSFIFQIASNLSIDFLRKAARDKRKQDLIYQNFNQFALSVEEVFLVKEKSMLLSHLISQLPAQRQEVFRLCKIEGYTYQEAADKLGISPSTVSNQLVSAVKSLKSLLRQHREDILFILLVFSFL